MSGVGLLTSNTSNINNIITLMSKPHEGKDALFYEIASRTVGSTGHRSYKIKNR